jgi:predicted dehydrogenase
MVEAAHRVKLLLMESWSYRFHPRSRLIKKMIGDGVIGSPSLLRIAFCFHLDQLGLSGDTAFRLNPDKGGGALLDVGCYGVSLARWLLGLDPTVVQAQSVYHPSGVDLHTVGSLRFPGDMLATIEASFITALQQTFTIVGSDGVIELPHDAFIPWKKDACFTVRGRRDETGIQHHCAGADAYQLMVEHFSDAVMGRLPLAYPSTESVSNMQTLDALARAAKTGSTVRLHIDTG